MPTLVDCPQSNIGTWSFRLFGVDVHVKLWFWFAILILCGDREPGAAGIWIAVCFGSILLHEFGHVLAFRLFGTPADVILYAWGGLAVPHCDLCGTLARFVVALAGPSAGFLLAAIALWATGFGGGSIHLDWHFGLPALYALPPVASAAGFRSYPYHWYVLLNDLLFVNFYWGLINLLPVYPLDGGHAARAVFEHRNPFNGRRQSLILSAVVAGAFALVGVAERSLYLVVIFAIMAVSSLQSLESEGNRTRYRR
jgi:stage IV sporulation protein FB